MIKSFSLSTSAIDFAEDALRDITEQLGGISLRQHTVGILVCHYDYVSSGAYAAICEALSFPVVGCTTFNQATVKARGLFELTLTVLTSDDVSFSVAKSDDIDAQTVLPTLVSDTYRRAIGDRQESPSMLLSFMPIALPFSGDAYLRETDALTGYIPHFGVVTTGDDDSGQSTWVLYNGEAILGGIVMLLLFGDVSARFYYGSFPEANLLEYSSTVTKSSGTWVQEIGGQPTLAFLERNGFESSEEAKAGLVTLPFMHHRAEDKTLIARTMVDFNDDGHALFYGEIPEGSVMRVATVTTDELLAVTRETVHTAIQENPDAAVFFIFSCIGRYIALGMDITSEIDSAVSEIPDSQPYLMSYAGGEICPVSTEGNAADNRFHNSSIIVCALR